MKRPIVGSLVAFAVAIMLFPLFAFAQAADTGTQPPDIATLIQLALQVVADWRSAGAIAGCIALVNLLTNLTKLKAIDDFLGRKFWIRPLVSILLGAATAFLAALATGAPVLPALLAGVVAGLGGSGVHELVTVFNGRVQAERAAGAKLVEILSVEDAKVTADAVELHKKLDELIAIPDQRTRLEALANWANGRAA